MQYEVEKRAFVNENQRSSLKKFLNENGKLVKKKKRCTFIYMNNQNFEEDSTSPIDLKVRTTNGKAGIALKYGNCHNGETREEYEVDFDVDNIDDVLGILKRLGYQWGITTYLNREEYEFEDMTIEIDDYYELDRDLIEVEIVCHEEDKIKEAEIKILEFLKKMNLEVMDSDGMKSLVHSMNVREDWQFDFSKQDIQELVERRKDFILCKI
jgi:predicted adenylyl cyclase CyaB